MFVVLWLRRKNLLPGNRKLVLEVIRENPRIKMWQIRPLLREKHKDWHPSTYTLINHVLGLHSDGFIRISARDSLDSFCQKSSFQTLLTLVKICFPSIARAVHKEQPTPFHQSESLENNTAKQSQSLKSMALQRKQMVNWQKR